MNGIESFIQFSRNKKAKSIAKKRVKWSVITILPGTTWILSVTIIRLPTFFIRKQALHRVKKTRLIVIFSTSPHLRPKVQNFYRGLV